MGIPSHSEPVAHLVSAETARRIDNEEPFEWTAGSDVSVGRLVRQQFGDDLVDHVISALLGGVYSCSADDLGLRATIPALAETLDALSERGPSLSAAVRSLEEARAAKPSNGGPSFRPSAAATQNSTRHWPINPVPRSTSIPSSPASLEKAKNSAWPAHPAIPPLTACWWPPRPRPQRACFKVSPRAAERLKSVKLAASAVVGLKFDSDTDPAGNALPQNSGILVATDQDDVHAKAFTLSSRKWPHLAERGGALVRASFGRFGDDSIVRAEEDDLVDYALDDLQRLTGFDGRAAALLRFSPSAGSAACRALMPATWKPWPVRAVPSRRRRVSTPPAPGPAGLGCQMLSRTPALLRPASLASCGAR